MFIFLLILSILIKIPEASERVKNNYPIQNLNGSDKSDKSGRIEDFKHLFIIKSDSEYKPEDLTDGFKKKLLVCLEPVLIIMENFCRFKGWSQLVNAGKHGTDRKKTCLGIHTKKNDYFLRRVTINKEVFRSKIYSDPFYPKKEEDNVGVTFPLYIKMGADQSVASKIVKHFGITSNNIQIKFEDDDTIY